MKSFQQQVETLVDLDYPMKLGWSATEFRDRLAPLSEHVPATTGELDILNGKVGFVLVVNTPRLSVDHTLPLIVRQEKPAIERLFPRQPAFFKPVPGLIPAIGDAYLLLDIDRGNDTLNMIPLEAARSLELSGRTPVTLEEGVALLTQFPDLLQPNRCFMMLGSRGPDKRVPALWLSNGQPKLGWCWEGNPHTWLGFASARKRSPAICFETSPTA